MEHIYTHETQPSAATPENRLHTPAHDDGRFNSDTQPMLQPQSPDIHRAVQKSDPKKTNTDPNMDFHQMTYDKSRDDQKRKCSFRVCVMGTLITLGLIAVGAITTSLAIEPYEKHLDEVSQIHSSMNAHFTLVPEHNGNYTVWVSQGKAREETPQPYLSVNVDFSGDEEGYRPLEESRLTVTYILLSYSRDDTKFPSVKIKGDQVFTWIRGSPVQLKRHLPDYNSSLSVIGDPVLGDLYPISVRCIEETSVTLSVLGSGYSPYSLLSVTSFDDIWNDIF